MKKLIYLCCISAAAFAFQSCNQNKKDAKDTADSLNKTKDTSSNTAKTGGIAVNSDDAKFATDAANGGMAEVELGKLALTKAHSESLKGFAQMMVDDHGKTNEELRRLAKAKNITLPDAVDPDHRKDIADLEKKHGSKFDKAYADAMIDGHRKTLDLMNKEAKDGRDPDLKAFAAKTAPIVQMHLNKIKKIDDRLK
jgi:putative membrane protein